MRETINIFIGVNELRNTYNREEQSDVTVIARNEVTRRSLKDPLKNTNTQAFNVTAQEGIATLAAGDDPLCKTTSWR